MKPKFRTLIAAFAPLSRSSLIVCASLCTVTSAQAASQTWSATPVDANWANGSNWSGGAAPGITYVSGNTVNGDVATFNSPITTFGDAVNPVQVDLNRMIGGITYDTANVGAYVISGNPLKVSHNGAIQLTADVAAAQTINAGIVFRLPSSTNGAYAFRNNATAPGSTLTFNGTVSSEAAGTRPVALTLDGSNTGNNEIAGALNHSFGQKIDLIKAGSGVWSLSGVNDFGNNGSPTNAGSVAINAGKLVAKNASALSTNTVANAIGVFVNNTGTLEITNGVTMDNGLSLNLASGGTIRGVGAAGTNGRVNVSTAAAVSATLSTVGPGDVFTIGNAANEVTGGATDTILNVSGPGTISLGQASNYAGGWSIDAGLVLLGNVTALGAPATTGVSFGAGSTGTLRLNAFSPTITRLSTNATPGTPVVENGTSGTSLLTVNNPVDNTFAGSLNNGAAGDLALTKGGAGTLTLNGANTYTGTTLVTAGGLKINSSAATASVTVSSGATFGGSGTLANASVSLAAAARLAPGNGVGTLTTSSLSLASGTILDYEFKTGPASNDLTVVTASGGLTLSGGGINLYQEGGTTQFSTPGTYDLFQYSGGFTGNAANLSVLNPDPTKNYVFSSDGTKIQLTITVAPISTWALTTGGSWASAGSWSGGIPNGVGSTALFSGALLSSGNVVLDGGKTVSTLAFDNLNSYTISPAAAESLTLATSGGTAQIIGTNGSHQITAPLVLSNNTSVSVANSVDSITLSGIVSGAGSLSKGGPGTLVLNAANTYLGTTTINSGVISFATGGLSTGALNIGGGTLQWKSGNADDISSGRTVGILAGNATFDTNGNSVVLGGAIGNSGTGGLFKTGAGSLTLAAGNTYSGNTQVSSGTLAIGIDSSLGVVPGIATPGSVSIGAGTLAATSTFTVNANRGITLTSPSSTISVAAGSILTYGGIIEGAGKLNVAGPGTLNLTFPSTFSGGTLLPAGSVLELSGAGFPGAGQLEFQGGTLTLNRNPYNQTNVFVDSGNTGTIDGLSDRSGLGGLTGSGTITLITRHGGSNSTAGGLGFRLINGSNTFSGTINLKSGTGTVNTFSAYFNGTGGTFDGNLPLATVIMTDNARIGGVNNSGGNTMTIGALIGDSTAILSGADYAGTHTYNIGSLGLDTTFAGLVNNGSAGAANIIKSGSGTFTLSGNNTYTGTTTVNDGVLAVVNASSLGSATGGTTIAGGTATARVSITGGLTVAEPWTLNGRNLNNSPAIVSVSGANILSGLVSPATSGDLYNIASEAGSLNIAGGFLPTGAVTGQRFLQLFGEGATEWSGAIQNGTAIVNLYLFDGGIKTLSGANTFTGETVVDSSSTLVLAPTGRLKFAPAANNTSNKITGSGTATLNGKFDIDFTNADATEGNSWLLVDVVNLTESFGAGFAVNGFAKSGTNWLRVSGNNNWTFSQSTGLLTFTVVPTAYGNWIEGFTFPLGADLTAEGDPDGDGMTNQQEYAFGLIPNDGASVNPIISTLNNTTGQFTYTRRDPSLTGLTSYKILTSTTLDAGSWTVDATATANQVPGLVDGNGNQSVLVTLTGVKPLTATKLFVRVSAE